ncbi:MAG: hypothetical protein IJ435_09250 [Clostridia bacterium]|nr:hypothetical protein [Clostridia bacterium]
MKKLMSIVLGAILIAWGVVYILGLFGIADIEFSLDGWWTLFIIIPCLNSLITSRDKTGSAIGLGVGILLLLAAQEVIEYDVIWKLIVPIIIIMIGIKMIKKSICSEKAVKKEAEENGEKECMAAFSSETVDYSDEEISVAKVSAVFGGVKCNLTDAKLKDGSIIDLLCLFGGADIIVPENVNVKMNAFCLFGGISDKRQNKSNDLNAPTVNINGFCMFGGADIK